MKSRFSLTKLHPHALTGQTMDESTYVDEVAGEPSMLCTATMFPSRANWSSSVSCGLLVSLPEACR